MNLYTALQTSWNGLRNSEKGISIAAKNITHANDEDYTRLVLNSNYDKSSGNEVIDVRRIVDEVLVDEIISQNSRVEYFDTKLNFIDKVQLLLGKPETINENIFPSNLTSAISKMFGKLSLLSSNSENLNARSAFVNQVNIFTNMISDIKHSLNDLKNQTISSIEESVNIINSELIKLQNINNSLLNADKKSDAFATLKTQQTTSLKKLAKYLEVNIIKNDNERVFVYTKDGKELLTNMLTPLIYDSNKSHDITLGEYSNIDTKKNSFGKLKALYEIQDFDIPALIDEIDNLTNTLKNEFNAIYSEGLSSFGKNSIISTTELNSSDLLNFRGNFEVVLLDNNSNQAKYSDGNKVKPLVVSLDNKKTSEIIHEINEYFHINPTVSYISDEVRDIRLVARSLDKNKFYFDFLCDVTNSQDITFSVFDIELSYTDDQANTSNVAISDALISNRGRLNADLKGNSLGFTNFPIQINLENFPTVARNFNIKAQILLNGKSTTINYVIDKEKIQNGNLYWANNVLDPANISYETEKYQLVNASLVKNGNVNLDSGFLNIAAKNGFIALKNIDSLSTKDEKSSFVFSMGFNDFFVQDNDKFSVKSDILNNPYILSVSRFKDGNYDIGMGNNSNIMKLLSLSNKNVNFNSAGNLGNVNTTFFGYSTGIIENKAQSHMVASVSAQYESDFKNVLEEKNANISGVNIDEEIANTKIFEYLHNASKKVIEISDNLIHQLLDIV